MENKPEWYDAWTTPRGIDAHLIKWIVNLPDATRNTVLQLPPGAVVRSRKGRSHLIPPAGGYAIVHSYFENGLVSVRLGPQDDSPVAECDPNDLEAVGYHAGWSPAVITKALLLRKESGRDKK